MTARSRIRRCSLRTNSPSPHPSPQHSVFPGKPSPGLRPPSPAPAGEGLAGRGRISRPRPSAPPLPLFVNGVISLIFRYLKRTRNRLSPQCENLRMLNRRIDLRPRRPARWLPVRRLLKKRYPEYIVVMERMDSKRIHYHLLVVLAEDVRTGFDFAAVKRGDYRSASDYMRREWKFWRETAPKYGFGRTELLPIKKTADGVAKYISKYISKHIGQRLPEDKGARLVRYSRGTGRAGSRFDWISSGAVMWRQKLGAFCRMFNLNSDNYREYLKEWFGRNWVYHLRPLIESIKLTEYFSEEESRASLHTAWLVAVNERERKCNCKRRNKAGLYR